MIELSGINSYFRTCYEATVLGEFYNKEPTSDSISPRIVIARLRVGIKSVNTRFIGRSCNSF